MRFWFVGLLLLCVLYLCYGSSGWIWPWHWGDKSAILISLRAPRLVAALTSGAILGAVGAAFQMVFRNPLAEPYVLGVSSGAALGGGLAMAGGFFEAGWRMGGLGCAVLGGLLALQIVLWMARGRVPVSQLLLGGVILGAVLSSLNTVVLLLAGEDTNRVLRWLLGSLSTSFWEKDLVLVLVAVVGLPLLWRQSRQLNALSLGEETAASLGVDTWRVTSGSLRLGTALASVVVGVVGVVGFVGLVAPHIVRRSVGADLRFVLPWSAMVGAGMMVLADLVAQKLIYVDTLPVGAVTALIGAPALIWVLRRDR